ncbi:3'-5' exonuclease, partial [Vibrio sp. 1078-1]|nr:3'-5' exonuclease [Vibrio sp. 1078-1]
MIKKLFQKPAIQWPTKFQQKLELVNDENLVAFYGSELPAPNTPISEVEFVAL